MGYADYAALSRRGTKPTARLLCRAFAPNRIPRSLRRDIFDYPRLPESPRTKGLPLSVFRIADHF